MSQVLEEELWVLQPVLISVLLGLHLPLWEWAHLATYRRSAKLLRVTLQEEEEVSLRLKYYYHSIDCDLILL